MSAWRRLLVLVLVVLAGLAGTRVDLCLCAGAETVAAVGLEARPAVDARALDVPTPPVASCCCAPPEAVADACGCCGTVTPATPLPLETDRIGAPPCDCPGLDLSASTPEPAGASSAAAGAIAGADERVHLHDLAPPRDLAPRVAAFTARAGPTTRPPPGPLRLHLALHILRC